MIQTKYIFDMQFHNVDTYLNKELKELQKDKVKIIDIKINDEKANYITALIIYDVKE